jgi:hypothetical protein
VIRQSRIPSASGADLVASTIGFIVVCSQGDGSAGLWVGAMVLGIGDAAELLIVFPLPLNFGTSRFDFPARVSRGNTVSKDVSRVFEDIYFAARSRGALLPLVGLKVFSEVSLKPSRPSRWQVVTSGSRDRC